MKSLKERLEKKIEMDARSKGYGPSYKAGAASLVPFVVELYFALEDIAYEYSEDACDQDYKPHLNPAYSRSTEALQSIEKFMEGK